MKNNQIELMQELTKVGQEVLGEVFTTYVKPLIQYRIDLEKKIANKEITEMYQMEAEVGGGRMQV